MYPFVICSTFKVRPLDEDARIGQLHGKYTLRERWRLWRHKAHAEDPTMISNDYLRKPGLAPTTTSLTSHNHFMSEMRHIRCDYASCPCLPMRWMQWASIISDRSASAAVSSWVQGLTKVLWILGNSSRKCYATTPLHVRIRAVATILLASSDSTLGALRTATPIQPDLAPPRLRRRRHSWVSCQAKKSSIRNKCLWVLQRSHVGVLIKSVLQKLFGTSHSLFRAALQEVPV